jgi:SNF2 family DNA or RNA helicase
MGPTSVGPSTFLIYQMPSAELIEGHILVKTQFRDKELIKLVPGAKFSKPSDGWVVPMSWASCLILRDVFGERLEWGAQIAEWGRAESERVLALAELRALAMDPEADIEGDERLFPYQRTGVEFISTAERALLCDEMGTGKTVMGICVLKATKTGGPVLVVAPKSMKRTWATEFAKWAPGATVAILEGTAPKRRKVFESEWDVLIVNWEQLKLHSNLVGYGSTKLNGCENCVPGSTKKVASCERCPRELNEYAWTAVIADEVHRAKEPTAKQTRALKAASKTAVIRLGLTGTPIGNQPDELWSLLNFIDPDAWPSKTRYRDRYCEQVWNGWAQEVTGLRASTKAEFYELRDQMFLCRPKELVLSQLPPMLDPQVRYIEMDAKQAKAYKQMEAGQIADVDNGQVMAFTPLTVSTRLGQFACAFAELDEERKVRLTDPSNKLDEMMSILDELGVDEQVVMFAESRQLVELASQRLTVADIDHGMVVGGQSEEEREQAKLAFQAGDLRVLLVTLGAGGEGLTLTAARIALFLQLPWSLIKFRQALARVHRIGQERPVLPIILLSEGTIEEPQLEALYRKGDNLDEVVYDPAVATYLSQKGINV